MPRYSEKKRAALDAMMKEEVYRVAVEILTREGMAALTMERIAKEVGVSRGTLYNYFADSDAVMIFVEERTFEPLQRKVEEIVSGAFAPVEKLRTISRAIFTALYEDRSLVMALFPTHESSGPRCDHKAEQHTRAVDALQRVVREGIADGSFRKVPPVLVGRIYFGAVTGLLESMVYSGEFLAPDDVVPGFVDFFLSGLGAGG